MERGRKRKNDTNNNKKRTSTPWRHFLHEHLAWSLSFAHRVSQSVCCGVQEVFELDCCLNKLTLKELRHKEKYCLQAQTLIPFQDKSSARGSVKCVTTLWSHRYERTHSCLRVMLTSRLELRLESGLTIEDFKCAVMSYIIRKFRFFMIQFALIISRWNRISHNQQTNWRISWRSVPCVRIFGNLSINMFSKCF